MNKFNFKFISKTMGFLLIIESLFILLSAIVSFYFKEQAGDTLLLCGAITIATGIVLRLLGSEVREKPIGLRESYVVVTLAWVLLSFFGMLPYYLYGTIPSVTDAYFETISGFTTTGSTILTHIDDLPKGLLFWRSLTQWIGGMGIVVFALAILPMIGGNASVLFDAESSGIAPDRFQPRVTKIAKRLWFVYVLLTSLMVVFLILGPMDLFDAVCHAMTTLATGGYSTKVQGIQYWNSAYLEYVVSIFMFIGGINFSLLYFFLKGDFKRLFRNEELRWFFFQVVLFVVLVAAYLFFTEQITDVELAFRRSLFQISSVSTSTGFTAPDYASWGAFPYFIMFFAMFFCACVGSTSGGAKIVRLLVVSRNGLNEFSRQIHPNAILPVRLNDSVISYEIINKITVFILVYLGIIIFSSIVLTLTGMTIPEAIGNSLACMGNVGPGFGRQGLDGHFANTTVFAKWYLSFIMLVGRLELFTVLSLFIPAFWKK